MNERLPVVVLRGGAEDLQQGDGVAERGAQGCGGAPGLSQRQAAAVYRAAGSTGPERLSVPGSAVERSAEQVVAAVHSLSGAAPHLFGDRLADFDADLRRLVAAASPDGRFSEQVPGIGMDAWR